MPIPVDILIFAGIAAFLIYRLRDVLGTRHGNEPPPNNSSFGGGSEGSDRPKKSGSGDSPKASKPGWPFMNHVKSVSESSKARTQEAGPESQTDRSYIESPLEKELEGEARAAIKKIRQRDRQFSLEQFIENAQDAYTMLVEAYEQGDKDTLASLAAAPVMHDLERAINARAERGESEQAEIYSFKGSYLLDAQTQGHWAYITLGFWVEELHVIRDKNGEVITGDPHYPLEEIDIWTFGRNLSNGHDPRWLVYETRDGDKSQLPESSYEEMREQRKKQARKTAAHQAAEEQHSASIL